MVKINIFNEYIMIINTSTSLGVSLHFGFRAMYWLIKSNVFKSNFLVMALMTSCLICCPGSLIPNTLNEMYLTSWDCDDSGSGV